MNYRQIYARKAECEKRIKEVCPQATHESGIYCFTRVDEDMLEELEELLIMADVGVGATEEIIEEISVLIKSSSHTILDVE